MAIDSIVANRDSPEKPLITIVTGSCTVPEAIRRLQPVVRKTARSAFEIIVGERRWEPQRWPG